MANDELIIASLRGGQNDTDPASNLADDQCTLAQNVEFFYSMLGERRNGCGPLTITNSDLDDEAVIVHISQWFPTNVVTLPEIFAVGATSGVSVTVSVSSTALAWNEITTITDAFSTAAADIYQISTQSLSGELFVAYNNTGGSIDRLHKYTEATPGDSSTGSIVRTGLVQPLPPTAANSGGAGTIAAVRYYRVRKIIKNGTTIVSRSEPSTSLTFTPDGAHASVTITDSASISEGETGWELEASTDNVLFYVIATQLTAATTYVDSTADGVGYSLQGPLSDAIGSYLLLPNAKYLAVDGDRLIFGGHFTDKARQSQVGWTPRQGDPGVGNGERLPIVTTGGLPITSVTDLDNYDGGPLTGIAAATFGVWYAFKWTKIYQANRTSDVTNPYEMITISSTVGAIPGSIVRSVDESGATWIYFLDPSEGPYRIGPGGMQRIVGLRTTWTRVNLQAAKVISCGCYYPQKQQMHWWVTVDGADSPNLKLVLQVSELQQIGANIGRGWSTWTGRIAQAYCAAILTETITINGITSLSNRPFIGLTSPDYIQRCDVLALDAGVAYVAVSITKPFCAAGLLNYFGAMNASLLATQNSTSGPVVRFIRDLGVETNVGIQANLTPIGGESMVIVDFDSLVMSGCRLIQVQFSDT